MTGTNGNRPKVEIQLNESATLTLLKDKPYVGENSHGQFYLYSVQHDQLEKAFFAPAEIHQAILEAGLKAGDSFSVKKIGIQNGKKLSAAVEFAVVNKQTTPNGSSNALHATEDGFRDIMEKCLRESVSVIQAVNTVTWTTENITSIALTMFIQRSKMR
jgi:hypothetical protein